MIFVRLGLFIIFSAAQLLSMNAAIAMESAAQCDVRPDERRWSALIDSKGFRCLNTDLLQTDTLINFAHQSRPKDPLLRIRSADVELDLRGHQLSARTAYGRGLEVVSPYPEPRRNIAIRNGTIKTADQPAVYMVHNWNNDDGRFGMRLEIAKTGGDVSLYRSTDYVLDGLTLNANSRVIIMQGRKNVIRNCRIVGGAGAINLFGPELVFENNEIVIENAASNQDPVIYLEDADNSTVRDNKITMRGGYGKSAIIVIKNSRNVRVERNTLNGAGALFNLLDKVSNVIEGEIRTP
jgi:hypothetical protein